MKLTEVSIHGFGRFYRRTFFFQDGIHILYGPNEAGKSTLHTFIGCMLFGLERGRGKAARNDLYSRYLPWDHDAAYGGSLAFESGDEPCLLERSFRSGHRECYLTRPLSGRCLCPDNSLPESCYEGLTESLYYDTISIRQLSAAAGDSLAAELGRRLSGMYQSGSDHIDYHAAMAWLKSERKRQEAVLDSSLEKRILNLRQELSCQSALLNEYSGPSPAEEKAMLEEQADLCIEQLARGSRSESCCPEEDSSIGSQPPSRPFWAFLFRRLLPAALLFLLAAGLWQAGTRLPGAFAGPAAAVTGILALLVLLLPPRRRSGPSDWPLDSEEDARPDDLRQDENEPEEPMSSQRRLKSLQKRIREVSRLEWEQEQLLERIRSMEEDLEILAVQNTAQNEIRLELQAIALAMTTLQAASEQMKTSLGPHLNEAMSFILCGLTGGAYDSVYVDDHLNISVRAGSRTVPLESLSRGTIEQIWLSLRLAVIDLVFPLGGMPLLLDDCFLAYDDERLAHTLMWLAENYSGQIFIFTCQKREASLLMKERIPFAFTDISETPERQPAAHSPLSPAPSPRI